jgi:hypothetical protein
LCLAGCYLRKVVESIIGSVAVLHHNTKRTSIVTYLRLEPYQSTLVAVRGWIF